MLQVTQRSMGTSETHENAHNGAWWGHHTPRRSIYPEHKEKAVTAFFIGFYYCPVNLSSLTLNMGRDC